MHPTKLRAWWWHRQGLDGTLRGTAPAGVLERAGWARSVGGAGPYLTMFARGGTNRQRADDAVADLEIHELPAARGCTYVVPAADFALALTLARELGGADMKVAAKLGVTEQEIDRLCDAVLRALDDGPLDPEGIRERTGTASRSLGDAGKKKGMTTTLPLALGRLQVAGEIRRVPINGRLDQQRYRYVRWTPSPLAARRLDPRDAYTELARRFFRWVGPATLGEFQWFSALGLKAGRAAVEPLGLVPAEEGGDRLLLPDDAAAFRSFEPPAAPQYALVSSLDSIAAARRELQTLVEPADAGRRVMVDASTEPLSALADLPSHAILDRGRVIGLWEYDPESQRLVWAAFGGRADRALEAAVEHTEAFVRDQLGDARSFSLDSARSRAPRIEAIRRMR